MNKEFKNLFYEKLLLSELSFKEQSDFLRKMSSYLEEGRTIGFVSEKINKLLEFLYAIDLNEKDAVRILTKYPSILNTVDSLYEKYIFLGYIENLDNTVRVEKLLSNPKDYMIGLGKLYARFVLLKESGCAYTWNNLVHYSDREFCKIFISKPYELFSDELQVLDYLSRVDIKELDLSKYKELPVNEELVSRYESKGKRC